MVDAAAYEFAEVRVFTHSEIFTFFAGLYNYFIVFSCRLFHDIVMTVI